MTRAEMGADAVAGVDADDKDLYSNNGMLMVSSSGAAVRCS